MKKPGDSTYEPQEGTPPSELTPKAAPSEGLPDSVGSYRVLGELGTGAAAVVYSAQREGSAVVSALKVIRPGAKTAGLAERFKREAEVLKQLHHPGIAAFYDAGEALLQRGKFEVEVPFLCMELASGSSLSRHVEEFELDYRARVELVARICDAVAHAHALGVVHRDLKPANVLVVPIPDDPIGQPKVLDFGVARVIDVDAETLTSTDSGALLGTVPYMSPEQLDGKQEVDARSDIYALGILLFQILTGRMPYDLRGSSLTESANTIRSTEPTRLSRYVRELSGSIEFIVMQALEKDPARRYASANDLAKDLRAYLAGSPVVARAPGFVRYLSKRIHRHPIASRSILILGIGLLTIIWFLLGALDARDLARLKRDAANLEARHAELRQEEVTAQRRNVLGLSDLKLHRDLEARARELWPVHPDKLAALDEWIFEAEALHSRLASHHDLRIELSSQAAQAGAAEQNRELMWWIENLESLERSLTAFGDSESGTLASVRRRRAASQTLWARSIGQHVALWKEVADDILRRPPYQGLQLPPQLGLVPLWIDPTSGLWEFWHVESGTRPERDAQTNEVITTEGMGLIFVLIPGGGFLMGAQTDPALSHYYADAYVEEAPVHEVAVGPFFLSKYEMTQGQWLHIAGENPAKYGPGRLIGECEHDLRHPIESISWFSSHDIMCRLGLRLPTEAEWEYGARAGTQTLWFSGDKAASLEGVGNLKDQSYLAAGGRRFETEFFHPWADGYAAHSPVGKFTANAFGLHDVCGNVWEWCRDAYDQDAYSKITETSPCVQCEEEFDGEELYRIMRGGDCSFEASYARSARRYYRTAPFESEYTGLRPARSLDQ